VKALFALAYGIMMGGAYLVIWSKWWGVAVSLLGLSFCLVIGHSERWWR
jgi:hypothetical protein